MPSSFKALYDGVRRGKSMFYILPHTQWGGKAYGLQRPTDDFTVSPRDPSVGSEVLVTVSDFTYRRLVRQQQTRAGHRATRKRRR